MLENIKTQYEHDGYFSPLTIINTEQAARYRSIMEAIEAENGPLHYQNKLYTTMHSTYELATHPTLLDAVEALIGPDILLYNATFIVKEPHSNAHVSWHQDLTYWGLSSDAQVTAWIALSPATEASGCMAMIPGSHRQGMQQHQKTTDPDNVLLNGQTLQEIDTANAKTVPLAPGQASLHHGWTMHSSLPNRSDDRRIGLNLQFIATDVRQLKSHKDTALLVRGVDNYRHFGTDTPTEQEFDINALAHQQELSRRLVEITQRQD